MLTPSLQLNAMTPSRQRQPYDEELHCDAWESKQFAEIPNATTKKNQSKTHPENRKEKYKSNSNRRDQRRKGRNARREGATITSPIDSQINDLNGAQLEKSRKKKKERMKQKHSEQLLGVPANGSKTCDADYTLPLKDQSDRSPRDKADKLQLTSKLDRKKKGGKIENTDHGTHLHRTRSVPQTSYFELDLAHGTTPISRISMDEFDWLEDLYYEESLDLEDSNASESPFQEPDTDEAYVLSAALDQVDQIMKRNAYRPSAQIKLGQSRTTTCARRITSPLASDEESDYELNINSAALSRDFKPIPKYVCVPSSQIKHTLPMTSAVAKTSLSASTGEEESGEEESCGEHTNVVTVAPNHVEQITKKISFMSPQINQTLLRTHTTLSSTKKSNSSEGGSISATRKAGYDSAKIQDVHNDEPNYGNSSYTDSYLESSEWKAREELRQDWMHFIADRRPRRESLNCPRSSSVPNLLQVAQRVSPRLLGSKSTSLHVKRSSILSLSQSSAPPPEDDSLLLLKLDSWEVKQRKAVLERKIKDAKLSYNLACKPY